MSSESKTETEVRYLEYAQPDINAVGVQDVPLWNCGDPLKYPVPKEEEDLWDKLLRPLLERDKQQCDAWKDEVENLLIFVSRQNYLISPSQSSSTV